MYLPESSIALVRPYIVNKLSTVTEADHDVLADYVLELLKSDGDDATVRKNAQEQLGEFLEGGNAFVDDIFQAIAQGQFGQGLLSATSQAQAPTHHGNAPQEQGAAPIGDASRKRAYEDEDVDTNITAGAGRPVKTARRGGRGDTGQAVHPDSYPYDRMQSREVPGFDFPDPFAAMLAFQQALMSGNGTFPGLAQMSQGHTQRPGKSRRRCKDYDLKGICTRGAACRYDHGDHFEEYNPDFQPNGHGGGRQKGRHDKRVPEGRRGGGKHSPRIKEPIDSSITTIVVDNIPAESFSEDTTREFFSQFGAIAEITMLEHKRRAVVKYGDHATAMKAVRSPKVVFDNRFVRVYLNKPPKHGRNRDGHDPNAGAVDVDMAETPSPEAFAAQQAAAQERFEAHRSAKAAQKELEAKIQKQAEGRAKLLQELAGKTGSGTNSTHRDKAATTDIVAVNGAKQVDTEDTGSTQTAALRAKLAALEAEALRLGLNPHASEQYGEEFNRQHVVSSERGQPGAWGRGRGGQIWRGRGRGGRGAYIGSMHPGGAVKRLDNRPRVVSMVFSEAKSMEEAEEGLKQFLLFNNHIQWSKVSAHPSRSTEVALIVAFNERYRAESFIAAVDGASRKLPHVGCVDVSWVPNGEVPATAFPDGAGATIQGGVTASSPDPTGEHGQTEESNPEVDDDGGANGDGAGDQEVEMADDAGQGSRRAAEVDYDVADDDSRWDVA